MENQHKKIKNYRDLSQEEIDLMNRIKEKEKEVGQLFLELQDYRQNDMDDFGKAEQSLECSMNAETFLKTGFMWLVRAVALPKDPFIEN